MCLPTSRAVLPPCLTAQRHLKFWKGESEELLDQRSQFFKKTRQKAAWWSPENTLKAKWLSGYQTQFYQDKKKKGYLKHVSIITHCVNLRRNYQRFISQESRNPPPVEGDADASRGVLAERETSGNQTPNHWKPQITRFLLALNLQHSCSILRLPIF